MLSNHPHIAAQLAAAHRDDLLRQADSRRLRRFARAARRAERRAPKQADRTDRPDPTDRPAADDSGSEPGAVDEMPAPAARPIIEAEPAPLPGSAR